MSRSVSGWLAAPGAAGRRVLRAWPRGKRGWVAAGVLAWGAGVAAGLGVLLDYASAPGPAGRPGERWPAAAGIALDAERPTLVMVAHPRCPCTRASLEELSRLLARLRGRVTAHVLFFQPSGEALEWSRTDLWNHASSLPGVDVRLDEDAAQARRFGVETSGHVLLYGSRGDLLYSGGITSGRGHAGDNAGSSRVAGLVLRPGSGAPDGTPSRGSVFGCSLFEEVRP